MKNLKIALIGAAILISGQAFAEGVLDKYEKAAKDYGKLDFSVMQNFDEDAYLDVNFAGSSNKEKTLRYINGAKLGVNLTLGDETRAGAFVEYDRGDIEGFALGAQARYKIFNAFARYRQSNPDGYVSKSNFDAYLGVGQNFELEDGINLYAEAGAFATWTPEKQIGKAEDVILNKDGKVRGGILGSAKVSFYEETYGLDVYGKLQAKLTLKDEYKVQDGAGKVSVNTRNSGISFNGGVGFTKEIADGIKAGAEINYSPIRGLGATTKISFDL